MRRGDRGDKVRQVQEDLCRLGFGPLDLDGIFGRATETAVKLYQKGEGLAQDGIVGPKTLAALQREEPSPSTRYPGIIHALERKGYSVHHDGQINIVGVRTPTRRANAFDDWIYLAWVQSGQWHYRKHAATTDPGLYWLEEGRVDGTAVMVPGQYPGYEWGLHRGQYETLVQRAPVKVFRDANGDDIVDTDPSTIETGWGLNLHHAGQDSSQVNRWSAGCQVWARLADWEEAMRICRASLPDDGKFTYTLLLEEDTT